MNVRLSLVLVVTILSMAGSVYSSSDTALLYRLQGTYFGRELAVLRSPAEPNGRSRLVSRYIMPNGRGVVRAFHRDPGGGRARMVGHITRVKCRGNRAIYQGTARFKLFGRTLTARRFRAIASERANASATLFATGRYALRFIRFRGTFNGKK